ncbi:citrate synthase [Halobacillus karajensis]|uniref:Citrate synthase n=1 Tax=Halobacillus karajensis TaxID=195088 RepID=A0A024P4K8_9BACI|nr:citrate synthase [Halobacillus karajensis]CDQ20715.1 2-methylcitrate synthase [Halobacillus karajensis]CDQ23815.1 2-methylcitrate synthase [Halobacillus karajensis]CDQ27293.1 2-methylcitrate synthase [Halobacillus karajensis]
MPEQTTYKKGLDGVIATETKLSYLDVDAEEIVLLGYDLIELAESKQYLDLVQLLLRGQLPDEDTRPILEKELKKEYELPEDFFSLFHKLPKKTHPMDALRTGISALAGYEKDLDERREDEIRQTAIRLLAKIPNIVANSYRTLHDEAVIEPDQTLSYSANFLYMITGKEPTAAEAAYFDQSLMVYSEHEMPNSTFTARVIASTNADIYGALTGAVASLKGNLHGGANEAVMHMLLEGGTTDGFRHLLYEKLTNKEKVMGFGHRVYMKKMDPRAALMKEALRELSAERQREDLFEMCEAGEQLMKEEKGLYPNLDYYAAPVYYLLGIPIDLYTPIFFAARTLGLCAHVSEQYANNKLFRPRVLYTGPRGLHP